MAKYKLSKIFDGTYSVSQLYGANPAYYSQFGLKGHEGVDYATPIGVKLLNPFEKGVVLRDNDDFKNNAYGNYDVIWDPVQKCAVWFCHQSGNSVSVGQELKRGQASGLTGNSGNSSGPHLHLNFVETDASGNRLNTNNGYQGFLNILDPNLVEWIISSQTPMDNNVKKAVQFDRTLTFLKGVGYISSDDSNQYLDGDKFVALVKGLWADRIVDRPKAGNWDRIVMRAGLPSNSTVDQVVAKLQTGSFDKNKFLEAVKKLLFG